jgi:hypothetical protein
LLSVFLVGLFGAAILSGCAIRLAPAYDADLLDGLNKADQQTLVLFAKLEPGTTKAEFDTYSDEYAQDIAAFEALRQRADARPFPPLASHITKLKFLSSVCNPDSDPKSCLDASGKALEEIVATLSKMRDTHRSVDMPKELVQNFRDRFNTNIHTALTIESALKR